jgi:hypothetical protein
LTRLAELEVQQAGARQEEDRELFVGARAYEQLYGTNALAAAINAAALLRCQDTVHSAADDDESDVEMDHADASDEG